MAILTRDDGVAFAIYTYRELITAKKGSLLKNELMLLSRDNGEYARFYDKPSGDFEAVFGHEPGYLLGENVWHYFKQPKDLIYCEQLADGESAILVVVRDSNVFIDAKLPLSNLLDEFLGLIAGDNRFDIYIYGDLIPLAEAGQEDKFAFDPNLVKSFNQLEEPVFDTLPLDENFQLIPINKAIAELGLAEKTGLKWGISLLVLLALAFGIYKTIQQPEPLQEVVQKAPTEAPVDPYEGYRAALSTPNPSDVLMTAWSSIQQLSTVPGWTPSALNFDSGLQSATVTLTNDGGDTSTLLAWARQHQLDVAISGEQPTLSMPYQFNNRRSPRQIYQLKDTAAMLYDDLKRALPSGNVSLSAAVPAGPYGSMELDMTLQDVGETELELLAQSLENFPVQINALSFSIEHGAISATIKLTVYGVN